VSEDQVASTITTVHFNRAFETMWPQQARVTIVHASQRIDTLSCVRVLPLPCTIPHAMSSRVLTFEQLIEHIRRCVEWNDSHARAGLLKPFYITRRNAAARLIRRVTVGEREDTDDRSQVDGWRTTRIGSGVMFGMLNEWTLDRRRIHTDDDRADDQRDQRDDDEDGRARHDDVRGHVSTDDSRILRRLRIASVSRMANIDIVPA
jgi:hypothetical protein